MKTENNKKLETLVAGLMKDISTDATSPGFTNRLMAEVHLTKMHKATIDKPLISIKGWLVISGCIAALAIYMVFNAGDNTVFMIKYLGITSGNANLFNSLSSFKFSDATLYAIVILIFLLFIQFNFIKQFLNKRLLE